MLTAEMVVDALDVADPVVSPDGNWVAYELRPVGEVWLAGASTARRLAAGSKPRWAADSRSLYVLVDGTAVHRVELAGTSAVMVTWEPGIDDHLPLADGVAFIAPDSVPDGIQVRGTVRPSRLRVADSDGIRVLYGDRHVSEVAQQPGGGLLAVLTWSSNEIDPGLLEPELHVVSLDGAVRDLGPAVVGAHSPVWRRAGDWRIAYLALTPPSLQSGVAVYDVVDGNLTAGMPACPFELVQAEDGDPLMVVAEGLDTSLHRLSAGLVFRHTGLVKQVSVGGDSLAAIVSTAYEPQNLHFNGVRVTDTRPWARDITWGTQSRLSYQASDGLELDGLLVVPAGTGPFPLITIVHGGPYDRYSDQFALQWAPSGQWLALAGYAVFLPNPRGSQGRGHAFAEAVSGAVGQEEWTDILTGIDLLIADGVADPHRLGIAGWSHGGFMTAWAIGHTDRFAAAVMGAGVTDWGMLAGSGEWGRFEAALGGSTGWEGVGPHPHDRLSPISYASAVRTPVLIVHGAEDTNVPLAQAEYFHRALRHYGAEHEFVVYPREGHSFRGRDHRLDLLNRTRAWFDRWL
ncbi:S9 family peptidase [Kutzneria kofuensis]|uniref:Dipeptidyl aminopeptidase/acylaminoacyl peptidase n=1 Tax=Kutzneria kofuensis TaxID=103725 RepID=A0A7W9KNP4_9PSEU|nr:S9 family peptidase [Kutzneria kofuensis]MBB5895901.1 dipeptidyl aminopeptidase/acylaminoacyl peptidase [Kutzneria kofuensis]